MEGRKGENIDERMVGWREEGIREDRDDECREKEKAFFITAFHSSAVLYNS